VSSPPATVNEAPGSPEETAPPEQATDDAVMAFPSEVESGSPEENASNQEPGVSHGFRETARDPSDETESAAAVASKTQVDAVDAAKTEICSEPPPAAAVNEHETAHDDAVLDMIALEMGALDFDEPETVQTNDVASPTADAEPVPEPIADGCNARPDLESESVPEIAAPPSLGASLLESGVVPRATTRSDPLAPIRRMTQAEKIAFFS
jgi:hypothetical protein